MLPVPGSDSARDGARHRLDEALGEGEPEAGALDVGALRAEAVEGFEEPLELLGAHAVAGVCDGDFNAPVGQFGALHGHLAAAPVVLDRVGEQVDEHLLESLLIGVDVQVRALVRDGRSGAPAPRRPVA